MEILNFIKKLLPRIERADVAEDLRTTEKELLKIGMPAWNAAQEHFKVSKPKSEDVKALQSLFVQNFDYRRAYKATSFIVDIESRLKNLHANVVVIQTMLDTVLEKDIITSGLTVRSVFVLRAAANMSMVSRYLLSLLNYIYMAETAERDEEVYEALTISKAELRYVEQNFPRFAKLFSEYAVEPEGFANLVNNLPEVYVNEKTKSVVTALVGTKAADPFESMGIAGFVGNPIYSVRLMVAQWQNDRYESAKSKKQQLELRLAYLEMKEKGKSDPQVEKEISVLQDRIEKLDYKIRETDKELGI